MFSKYDRLPDNFHDLKTTLQTEFNLLMKATLKNIEKLQEAVKLQQTYTTALCSHVSSIYVKLMQLDRLVQMHCLYPHPQSDVVQLNAPKYNLDIDGQTDQVLTPSTQMPPIQNNTHPGYQDTEQPRAEHPSNYRQIWKKVNSRMLI